MRLQKAKQEIGNKWQSTDLGEPKMLLGIQLKRDQIDNSKKNISGAVHYKNTSKIWNGEL